MKTLPAHLLQILLTLILVAGALWLYEQRVALPRQRIGIVDVAAVYRQKETEFTRLVMRSQNDQEREQALQLAQHFAKRLPQALEQLPQDCHCLVVIRTAVAGTPPQAIDLTARLQQKVDAP